MQLLERRLACVLALGVLAVLAGCNGSPSGSSADSRPKPAARGVSLGVVRAAAVDGATGGTVTSGDGRLTLSVPPGAIDPSSVLTITVDEITNTAPGGVGIAYRLRPEGVMFSAPVTLTFDVSTATSVDVANLSIGYQEPQGFWLRMRDVARDAAARTLSTTTTHFSDWTVVGTSPRDLRGPFTIQNRIGVPFDVQGTAALDFSIEDTGTPERPIAASYYIQWGTITARGPVPDGSGGTCDPVAPATIDLQANIAELRPGSSQFLWGVDGHWGLTCTPASGPTYPESIFLVFDTLGISHTGCTRSWLAAPTLGPSRIAGQFLVDCAADGWASASFDFVACTPGIVCAIDACRTGLTSCDTGVSVCVGSTPVADGTACGTDLACSAGSCVCKPGPSATCSAQGVCYDAAIACGTGSPVCAQTPKPNGTSCGTDLVCSGGSCVCNPGPSATCAAQGVCYTSAITCDTGSPLCTQTPKVDGTTCGTDQVCSAGSCVCSPGPSASCQPQGICYTSAITCDTGSPLCTQTPKVDGTTCGTDQVCSGGSCVCSPGPSASCQPQGVCYTSAITCDTGSPLCTQTPKVDGTTCGTDQVCSAGSCVCKPGPSESCQPQSACHDAAITCDTGTAVCTQTVKGDGATCGSGQACFAGACVATRTVTGTRHVRRWPDAGAPVSSIAPDAVAPAVAAVQALVPSGSGWLTYPGSFGVDGSFSIPNVPTGSYVIVLVDGAGVLHGFETSSSIVDLGYDLLGRASVTPATLPTPVTIDATWPEPWNQGGDGLQLTSSSADVVDEPLSGAALAAGVTASAPATELWNASASGGALNLLSIEDAVYVHHVVHEPLVGYDAAGAATVLTGISIVDGVGGTIAAPTAALVDPGVAASLTVDWRAADFEAFLATMGPGAVAATGAHRLTVGASAHPLARPAPVATRAPTLLRAVRPGGTSSAVLGPLAFSRFLDASLWNEWIEAEFVAAVSYVAPGATVALSEQVSVRARAAYADAAGATIVQPVVGPPGAIAVNGASAAVPQAGVGTAPLLTWAAPPGTAPASYAVSVYRLAVAGDGVTSVRTLVGTFRVAGTQLRVPPGVLVAGGTYFARVESRADAPDPAAPLGEANVGASAAALTATFSP